MSYYATLVFLSERHIGDVIDADAARGSRLWDGDATGRGNCVGNNYDLCIGLMGQGVKGEDTQPNLLDST